MPNSSRTVRLNQFQDAIAKSYECGEFAYLAEQSFNNEAAMKSEIRAAGDGLFVFLMTELSIGEDCGNLEDALRRMSTITDQVGAAKLAIERLADEASPKTV